MTDGPPPAGHNLPPLVDPELLAKEQKRVADFADAAGAWLDLGGIETEEQAGKIKDFIDGARRVKAQLDMAHAVAKKPHLEAGRAVDATFRPLTAAIDNAIKRVRLRGQPGARRRDARPACAPSPARCSTGAASPR